jgi:hypothetical protein
VPHRFLQDPLYVCRDNDAPVPFPLRFVVLIADSSKYAKHGAVSFSCVHWLCVGSHEVFDDYES